ncbi:hypothetical protein GCM10012275_54080 [Longimycelium tulufanense]|uniref:DUF4913 domain-containing protein n=1 Tax=Longimycelium tulufanense TaxID=907463 RepID=A0A8J3FXT2_9PSEU|nr:hypothetical protein [Longimycelium tulufanense]GGM76485.1 hypothetical protein GCM10012275_54080 [Longimycelium tulufanense]
MTGPPDRRDRTEASPVEAEVAVLRHEVDELRAALQELLTEEQRRRDEPAPWCWFAPPDDAEDPREALAHWVAFYNATYVGSLDGAARHRIPSCWRDHPGLAAEIATLAAYWRHSFVGAGAHPGNAQYWHDRYRPGFTDRIPDYVHRTCLDGDHQPVGAPARPDRWTEAETRQHTAGTPGRR